MLLLNVVMVFIISNENEDYVNQKARLNLTGSEFEKEYL